MATSEALKRAQRKYRDTTKTISIRFSLDKDSDVIRALESVENKTEYIRQLVRSDVGMQKGMQGTRNNGI